MPKKENSAIRLENISKKYSEYGVEVKALDNVSLDISSGDFVSIIGPSGCGKSTMLHCMGLLDRPSSGVVYIDGKDTSKISGKEIALFRGEKLGFVFQNYNLIPRFTVLENVMLPGHIMNKNPTELEKRAQSLLKEVGIEHRIDHKGIHLSGGEQQRVAIARALINEPVLVLADEPTGALDSEGSSEIMDILVKMNRKKHATFVFVTHDLDIAEYAEKTILLSDGKIVGFVKGDAGGLKKRFEKLSKKNKGKRHGN